MCLIAFAWNVHPRCPLVLIANRDEFHARPTAALAPWPDAPEILGGRDLQAGGGWLAVDATRPRLAAVTNVREPAAMAAGGGTGLRSRGALVRDYLRGDEAAVAFAERHRSDGLEYGPFNLLLRDGDDLVIASNRPKPAWETVAPGLHGLSNGRFDAPWPKTRRLVAGLAAWLASPAAAVLGAGTRSGADRAGAGNGAADADRFDPEPLFALLADRHQPDDSDLPDTGIGLDAERRLAPAFIALPGYGTRASQIIVMTDEGHVRFHERRFGDGGVQLGDTRRLRP